MSRHDPKVTKEEVIQFFRRHPKMKSREIAEHFNCSSAYVRATLGRAGLILARAHEKDERRPARSGIRKTLLTKDSRIGRT